jgi:hypothetical protein
MASPDHPLWPHCVGGNRLHDRAHHTGFCHRRDIAELATVHRRRLSTQCLDRRIPDKAMRTEEVPAWEAERNNKHAKVDRQFTTADVRVKPKKLYPSP